jgi:hypothetical protein
MSRVQKLLLAALAAAVLLVAAVAALMIRGLSPVEGPGPTGRPVVVEPPATSAAPASAPAPASIPALPPPSAALQGGTEPPPEAKPAGGEDLKRVLAEALARDFPEIELSEDDLSRLSAAVSDIRDSLQGLRAGDGTPETAAARKEFENRRDAALIQFERITGMSFQAFMRRASADGGVDEGDSDADEVILLPLAPRP